MVYYFSDQGLDCNWTLQDGRKGYKGVKEGARMDRTAQILLFSPKGYKGYNLYDIIKVSGRTKLSSIYIFLST